MNEPQHLEATPSNLKTVAYEPPLNDAMHMEAQLAETSDYLVPARRKRLLAFGFCGLAAIGAFATAAFLFFSPARQSLHDATQEAAALSLPLPQDVTSLESFPEDNQETWEPVAVVTPKEIPSELPREFVNSLGMKFVLIPAGSFLMGADDPPEIVRQYFPKIQISYENEYPPHRVTISTPFYMGIYEVTQAEFERVMGVNPSFYSPTGLGRHKIPGEDTDRFPVERVTWMDAAEFCRALSNLPEERAAQAVYRLPTEAEWEYACRAGSQGPYGFPAEELDRYAWHYGNSRDRVHPVGELLPNAWGLYDMHGNVWEWTADWYVKFFYAESPEVDPRPTVPFLDYRALRGGAYYNPAESGKLRASYRDWRFQTAFASDLGFRVVCEVGQQHQTNNPN